MSAALTPHKKNLAQLAKNQRILSKRISQFLDRQRISEAVRAEVRSILLDSDIFSPSATTRLLRFVSIRIVNVVLAIQDETDIVLKRPRRSSPPWSQNGGGRDEPDKTRQAVAPRSPRPGVRLS
jgi:hypothetical protein